MYDYEHERWMTLYQSALVELKHALMAGRILDARGEIAKRIEALKEIPGLHREERQAIDDALSTLRFLERDEVRYAAELQREVAQAALEKLGSLGPVIARLKPDASEEG